MSMTAQLAGSETSIKIEKREYVSLVEGEHYLSQKSYLLHCTSLDTRRRTNIQ